MTEGTKKIILAVDDAPENLDVVKGILAPTHTIKAVRNGEIFYSPREAQIVIQEPKKHDNSVGRLSPLANRPPAPEAFAPVNRTPSMHEQ